MASMIPFDWREPHVEAFQSWRKAVWNMRIFPYLEGPFSEEAKFWQMQYVTLSAQLVCDWAKYEQERGKFL